MTDHSHLCQAAQQNGDLFLTSESRLQRRGHGGVCSACEQTGTCCTGLQASSFKRRWLWCRDSPSGTRHVVRIRRSMKQQAHLKQSVRRICMGPSVSSSFPISFHFPFRFTGPTILYASIDNAHRGLVWCARQPWAHHGFKYHRSWACRKGRWIVSVFRSANVTSIHHQTRLIQII